MGNLITLLGAEGEKDENNFHKKLMEFGNDFSEDEDENMGEGHHNDDNAGTDRETKDDKNPVCNEGEIIDLGGTNETNHQYRSEPCLRGDNDVVLDGMNVESKDESVLSNDNKDSIASPSGCIEPENKSSRDELRNEKRETNFMRKVLRDIWLGVTPKLKLNNYTPSPELISLLATQADSRGSVGGSSGTISLLERTCLSNEAAVWLQVRL